MDKIKILQTGDLHFDTPFKDLSKELSLISKEELLEVFTKIIDMCIIEKIEILLLTGDIFDNLTVDKKTLIFLKKQLERIDQVKVFISPGNHDPYNERSFYRLIDWPNNVYIFKSAIEGYEIEDLKVVVWGGAFNEKYIKKSILKDIKVRKDYINIMTIHGDISNIENGNDYNPMTLMDIGDSNLDYIGIGHRHSFSEIKKERNTFYAYAGCPQGRGFDELEDKGIIIGEVAKGYVDLNFRRTSKRNYYHIEIDITGALGYEDIKNKILSEIKKEDRESNFYKIELKGEIESYLNINEKVLLEKLKNEFYFLKIKDKSDVKIDLDKILKDYSIKGVYARKLLEKQKLKEEDEEVIKMALKLGIQSLSEGEIKLNDYL